MPDILTTLQELLYSASRAGYDPQNCISHLLFSLVLHCRDTYLQDTIRMLSVPTKRLLCSHHLISRQLFDDDTCASALETFTCASNVSLLTQAIKSCSAPCTCCVSSPFSRRPRQHTKDSSRATQGKPRSSPSPFKKKGGGSRST